MKLSWIFLTAAIAVAIFSDQIDQAANGSRKVRKILLTICAAVGLISVIPIILSLI